MNKSNVVEQDHRRTIAEDVTSFMHHLAGRSSALADLVNERLYPIMASAPPRGDDVECIKTEEYPPLFSEMRASLLTIEAAIVSIEVAISRMEL